MTDDNRVDDDLKQFLDWNAVQARNGYTIANMMARQEAFFSEFRRTVSGQSDQIHHLNGRVSEVEADNKDLRNIVEENVVAIGAIKRRVRNGPHDEEMDTGVHQIAAIQARLAEQERRRMDSERVKADDVVWWKRSIIGWVAGGVGVVITSLLTVLITLAVANSRPAPQAPPPPPPPLSPPR